ncbi:MAG: class I SAM-dependent RNA methyltransferase [Alphaproteobacteria bacterium]|nr:class I SAM-dependent RNA methyltransferase [Alphaproteobacteria bacterium]
MRVKIDHIGAKGDGVAVGPDGPIYVPFAVDGDELEISLQGSHGRIRHLDQPSPVRIDPLCRHFGRCGGCALQHVSPRYYARWKQTQIRTALGHRGIDNVTILDVVTSPLASRRRARLTVIGQIATGFSARASHSIIDITECPVLAAEIMAIINPLREFFRLQLKKRQKMTLQITLAENGLDLILEGAGEPGLDLRMAIAAFAEARDIARICWQDSKLKKPFAEILCERRQPFVTFGTGRVYLPPAAFLQATKAGEVALSHFVTAALQDAGRIVDIFAGCGTFTVALIPDHAVHAVDGAAAMITALTTSCRHMGQIRVLTTEVRDLFLRPLRSDELNRYDAAIIDPPRAGARDQMQEIVKSDMTNIVMISCNAATFARDARILVDGGFTLGAILPVDQFLFSPHIEIITTFRRDSRFPR